jgi:hypothetical protein
MRRIGERDGDSSSPRAPQSPWQNPYFDVFDMGNFEGNEGIDRFRASSAFACTGQAKL